MERGFIKSARAGARKGTKAAKTEAPVVDIGPMWDGLEKWVTAQGGVRNLTDADLSRVARATLAFDLCARLADITCIVWAEYRTEPHGVEWSKADVIFLLAYGTKEEKKARSSAGWTELPLYIQTNNATTRYRKTLSLSFLEEYTRRVRTLGPPAAFTFNKRTVWAPYLFPTLEYVQGEQGKEHRIRALGQGDRQMSSDRVSKAVKWLMSLATPPIMDVDARYARHIGATMVKHLWVDTGKCERAWLTRLLRHADAKHDDNYVAPAIPDAVRERRKRLRGDETFTLLIRS